MHISEARRGQASHARNSLETRAVELIDQLIGRREFFVVAFVDAVLSVPSYSSGPVDAADLRQTAADSFTVLTERLRECVGDQGSGARQRLVAMARDLARRRAEQGIELDRLVEAVRIDFTVLWEQLRGISTDGDALVLVELAEPLRHVVEEYASAVYGAFLTLREAQARQEAATLQQYLGELLTRTPDAEAVRHMAAALGVSASEALVLAAAPASLESSQLHDLARRYARFGCHAATVGAHDFVLFPAGQRSLTRLLQDVPCAVLNPVAGLASLSAERHRAVAVADLLRPDDEHSLTVETAWARVAASANALLGNDLTAGIEEALQAVRPSEAARVRETVQAFLSTGSAKTTAEMTYCHRNTVLNHIRRFTELTGLDATVPREAAKIVIAWS